MHNLSEFGKSNVRKKKFKFKTKRSQIIHTSRFFILLRIKYKQLVNL